jgi:hypothetical protein
MERDADGVAAAARFSISPGLVIESKGNLYVLRQINLNNNWFQKLKATKAISKTTNNFKNKISKNEKISFCLIDRMHSRPHSNKWSICPKPG